MSFSILRNYLQKEPSYEVWQDICEVLEQWSDASTEQVALDYIKEHTHRWPEDIRHHEDIKGNRKKPIYWPLVTSTSYVSKRNQLPQFLTKEDMKQILYFRLSGRSPLNIESLAYYSDLKGLSLELLQPNGTDVLPQLSSLERLELRNLYCYGRSLLFLRNLEHLTHLEIAYPNSLSELQFLPKNLQVLKLEGCFGLRKLNLAPCAETLKELHIHSCHSLEKLQGLHQMETLERIEVHGLHRLGERVTQEVYEGREEVGRFIGDAPKSFFQRIMSKLPRFSFGK